MIFSIQMQGGSLDLYRQDISWEFESFRFLEGLRDSFSTDITLPKTPNNCNLLNISGLLDSDTQLFGERIQPCVLEINGETMDVYLQIVSITDDLINICLYERTLPVEEREKSIGRMVEDNNSTILAWNVNSTSAYPQWFKKYFYGMTYDHNYAQYHPVMKLNDIIDIIASDTNLTMEHVDDNCYTMATMKSICPQNERQTFEGVYTDEGFVVSGGQHITNDLRFQYGASDTDKITFNRHCHVDLDIWVSWHWRTNGYKVPLVVTHHKAADSTNVINNVYMDAAVYVNKVETASFSFDVESGDFISFFVPNGNLFTMVRCVGNMIITDYEINEEDYGESLDYVGRVPRLIVYNWAANSYDVWNFDASTYILAYAKRGSSITLHASFTTPWTSFAWFGFWANMPDMNVSDFLWGMCWVTGRRIKFRNGEVFFTDANTSVVLEDASITEVRPVSERFGRKNYVRWNDDDDPVLVSEIPNTWLEAERNLHVSPFGKIKRVGTFAGEVNQYSNPEYDADVQGYKCDFEEVGFLVWYNDTQQGGMTIQNDWIRGLSIKTFGLEKITQVMEVTIESRGCDTNVDYLYLDGRKYMVVEGDTDLNTKVSTVTAVLVPDNYGN